MQQLQTGNDIGIAPYFASRTFSVTTDGGSWIAEGEGDAPRRRTITKKNYHQLETSAFVTRDSLQDALTTPPCSFQTAFAFVQFEFTAIMHLDNDFNFIGNRGINPPPPERSDVKIPKGEEQERNLDTSLSGRQLDGGSKFSLRMSNKSGRILRLMKF